MNTDLREALAERIDTVGPVRPDLDTLVALGEARLRRRRRSRSVVVGGAIAAVVGIAVVLAGNQTKPTTQQPVHQPVHPPRQARPPFLESNEYLLQYASPSAADRALVKAVQHIRQCREPNGPAVTHKDNGPIYEGDRSWVSDWAPGSVDAHWGTILRLRPTYPHGHPTKLYAYTLARADNVVVVWERPAPNDRAGSIMTEMVDRALPQYHAGTAVPGGETLAPRPYLGWPSLNLVRQPGWPPQLTSCVNPSTWGAVKAQGATFVPKSH
jgi:hypothetical protein